MRAGRKGGREVIFARFSSVSVMTASWGYTCVGCNIKTCPSEREVGGTCLWECSCFCCCSPVNFLLSRSHPLDLAGLHSWQNGDVATWF